jgi:CheY-like chemotaxis protein
VSPRAEAAVNSRRSPRIEEPFAVRVVEASGKSWVGEAANLSPFGIKIREARIAAPAIVRLEFELPTGGARFAVTAVAIRTDPDGGAFAFINLARADFHRISNAVESLFLRRKLWIMIVEDDPTLAGGLADLTEAHDSATCILPSAEEALTYLAQDQPDAILLDLVLPGMSGLHFLDTLARQQLRIPVVVVSGAGEGEAATCLRLGALDFLRKPLNIEQLRLTLNMLELASVKRRLHDIDRARGLAALP